MAFPPEGVWISVKRVALVIVVAVALLGVQASSAASVGQSEAAVTVEGAQGPLVLEAGAVDGISADRGEVLVDTATGSAAGVAPDARYTYGDVDDPTATPAFTLTNADDGRHELALEYTGTDTEDPEANVQFRVYDAAGQRLGVVSEESGAVQFGVEGTERVYVVVVIDTHGLTPASDLSGSLEMALR